MVLGSGSSGNCTLVEGARGRLLIDCGLSARETARRLERAGCAPRSVDALVISHEHSDHVAGAPHFSRKFGVPVYATRSTARAAGLAGGGVAALVAIEAGIAFAAAGFAIHAFPVPHDAVDNVGMIVETEGSRLGYVTDLGHAPAMVAERLRGCDVLVAEANHDVAMLKTGPYPWSVKQRILGRHGHLSNDEMETLVAGVAGPRTRALVLAHLSRTNNTEGLALSACRRGLEAAGRTGVRLHVGRPREASEVVEVIET